MRQRGEDTLKKHKEIKSQQILYVAIVTIVFLMIAGFSIQSINDMRGAANVIHYTEFVGEATQIVVKEEMYGQKNDSLIELIDEITQVLQTGEGDIDITVLIDDTYQGHMRNVGEEWKNIKTEIYKVREGAAPGALYDYSENIYEDANLAAYAAHGYMENVAKNITITIYLLSIVFVLLMTLFLYIIIKSSSLASKAKSLNRIAYYDPYIGIANRAYCEKKIAGYEKNSYENNLAVLMFDLNNLKEVNDQYGHSAGDAMIRNFALALDTIGREYGFVGRVGGDEFLAIFENCNEMQVKEFMEKFVLLLKKINEEAREPWEKISCAAGYEVGYNGDRNIQELLKEADYHMYEVKRKMKEKMSQDTASD